MEIFCFALARRRACNVQVPKDSVLQSFRMTSLRMNLKRRWRSLHDNLSWPAEFLPLARTEALGFARTVRSNALIGLLHASYRWNRSTRHLIYCGTAFSCGVTVSRPVLIKLRTSCRLWSSSWQLKISSSKDVAPSYRSLGRSPLRKMRLLPLLMCVAQVAGTSHDHTGRQAHLAC